MALIDVLHSADGRVTVRQVLWNRFASLRGLLYFYSTTRAGERDTLPSPTFVQLCRDGHIVNQTLTVSQLAVLYDVLMRPPTQANPDADSSKASSLSSSGTYTGAAPKGVKGPLSLEAAAMHLSTALKTPSSESKKQFGHSHLLEMLTRLSLVVFPERVARPADALENLLAHMLDSIVRRGLDGGQIGLRAALLQQPFQRVFNQHTKMLHRLFHKYAENRAGFQPGLWPDCWVAFVKDCKLLEPPLSWKDCLCAFVMSRDETTEDFYLPYPSYLEAVTRLALSRSVALALGQSVEPETAEAAGGEEETQDDEEGEGAAGPRSARGRINSPTLTGTSVHSASTSLEELCGLLTPLAPQA